MSTATGQIIGALLSGSMLPIAIGFLWKRLRRSPIDEAEARRLNAEASHTEWQTLRGEIDRLTQRVTDQDDKIASLERQLDERSESAHELETENKRLRIEVTSLKKRVRELEAVIRIVPTTPDMQALLDKIDRKTASDPEKPK